MNFQLGFAVKGCVLSAALVLAACGGGGGGGGNNTPPRSSVASQASSVAVSSSSSSVSSSSSSSSSIASQSSQSSLSSQSSQSSQTAYDGTHCGEFTAINDSVRGNNYMFLAPEGECFGIVNDNSVRKTVPFAVEISSSRYEGVYVSSALKIVQVNNRYMSIAMEFSNAGSKAYCGFSNGSGGIRFYDESNQLLPSPKSQNWLTGSVYEGGVADTYRHCLGPGDTFVLTARYGLPVPTLLVHEGMTLDASVFESIARADATIGGYSPSRRFDSRAPDLLPVELKISRFQIYPKVSATFTNTTGKRIRLTEDGHQISYFDDEDYFVNYDFLYFSYAIGRRPDQANYVPNEDDYIIEAGENFSLVNPISTLATISPGRATKASVQLRFVVLD